MRRRKPERTTAWPTPPPELLRCHVEDWITAEDIAELTVSQAGTRCSPPRSVKELVGDLLPIRARRKWSRARRAWLEEHGVPPEARSDVIPHRGRPVTTGINDTHSNPQLGVPL